MPKTNLDFWQKKFSENQRRDALAVQKLEADGWTVVIIWECEIRKSVEKAVRPLLRTIEGQGN